MKIHTNRLLIVAACLGLFYPAAESRAENPFRWIPRVSGTANDLNAVEYFGASDLFIAVGDAGTYLTSADHGKTWASRGLATTNLGINEHLLAIAMGTPAAGDRYVAVGVDGIRYATDLAGLNFASDINGASTADLVDVVWAFNQFFVFDDQGKYHTSPAGSFWSAAQDIDPTISNPLVAAEFDGVILIVVAEGGVVYVTANGSTWTKISSANGFNLDYLAIGKSGGRIVATQAGGAWMTAKRTSDTVPPYFTFTGTQDIANLLNTADVTFGLSRFLAGGATSDGSFYFAPPNGSKWARDSLGGAGSVSYFGVAFGKRFVIVGEGGKIRTAEYSTDLHVGRKAGAQAGNDVYTTSGAGQSVIQKTRKRRRAPIFFKVQNDGPQDNAFEGDFKVFGSRMNRFFKVTYFKLTGGKRNVTSRVIRGTHLIDDLPCDAECQFRVDVRPARAAKGRKKVIRLSFVITSQANPLQVDSGFARVRKSKK